MTLMNPTTNTEAGAVADVAAKPVRVQLRRTKGWRMPENTVSVARPGFWGNPYRVVLDEMRWDGETVDDDDEPILEGPWLCSVSDTALAGIWFSTKAGAAKRAVELYRFRLERLGGSAAHQGQLPLLRGKNLACWCALNQPCHADVLLELANAPAHLSEQGATAS